MKGKAKTLIIIGSIFLIIGIFYGGGLYRVTMNEIKSIENKDIEVKEAYSVKTENKLILYIHYSFDYRTYQMESYYERGDYHFNKTRVGDYGISEQILSQGNAVNMLVMNKVKIVLAISGITMIGYSIYLHKNPKTKKETTGDTYAM